MQYRLFGYPVFVTPAIPENLAVGSGTKLSYVAFAHPRYLHIGLSNDVEIAVSTDLYFAQNQTAVRLVVYHDFAAAPAAGVVMLKGVA
jgi:HK97 family phage major capsid protein